MVQVINHMKEKKAKPEKTRNRFNAMLFGEILMIYAMCVDVMRILTFLCSNIFQNAIVKSERGPCHKHVCHFGSICVVKSGYAICECPTCSEEFEPVCGTDGISYTNVCKLKQEGCDRNSDIDVAYTGLCRFGDFVI
ncbi:UNVERIFIED_CONTAM: Agrn [Trichonephila clavipes]